MDWGTPSFPSFPSDQDSFDVNALNPLLPTEYADFERLVPLLTLDDPIDTFLPRFARGLEVLAEIELATSSCSRHTLHNDWHKYPTLKVALHVFFGKLDSFQ